MIEKLLNPAAFVLMAEFLKSDTGEATYSSCWYRLTQVPYLKTNEKVQWWRKELRIRAGDVGNLVVDQVAELLLPFLGQALQVITPPTSKRSPLSLGWGDGAGRCAQAS